MTQRWGVSRISGTVPYSDEVLLDGPLVYYRFNESSGTTAVDSVAGGERNGLYSGTPTLGITGLISGTDKAVSLPGTSGTYLRTPFQTWLQYPSNQLTVEFWFEIHTTPGGVRNVAGMWGPLYSWLVQLDVTVVFTRCRISGGDPVCGTAYTLSVGTKHHYAFTYDGSYIRHYIDGVEIGNLSAPGTLNSPAADVYIGRSYISDTENLPAKIDEFALYAKTLSPARILAHYQAGIA